MHAIAVSRSLGGRQSGITQKLRRVFASATASEGASTGDSMQHVTETHDTVPAPMDEHSQPTVRP